MHTTTKQWALKYVTHFFNYLYFLLSSCGFDFFSFVNHKLVTNQQPTEHHQYESAQFKIEVTKFSIFHKRLKISFVCIVNSMWSALRFTIFRSKVNGEIDVYSCESSFGVNYEFTIVPFNHT